MGTEAQEFTFDTSQFIKIGICEITSETGFISGLSKLILELRNWEADKRFSLKFDVSVYISNKKEFI